MQPEKLYCWLLESISESPDRRYRHRLLEEDADQRSVVFDDLKLYIRAAHEPARRRLRRLAGISLDPLGSDAIYDPAKGYPECLHLQTLKGYFGEVFAGLVAETLSPFGQSGWEVPAFLFRFHLVEFQQLEILRQQGGQAKQRPGRTGDDCLAFQRDDDGRITEVLYCEAKCTPGHESGMIADAHAKASRAAIVDIPQLIEMLLECDDLASRQWVEALRRQWLKQEFRDDERYDLVSYVCGRTPSRGDRRTWMDTEQAHKEYTAGRRLEAVEVHLRDVEDLVCEVYGKSRPAKDHDNA